MKEKDKVLLCKTNFFFSEKKGQPVSFCVDFFYCCLVEIEVEEEEQVSCILVRLGCNIFVVTNKRLWVYNKFCSLLPCLCSR